MTIPTAWCCGGRMVVARSGRLSGGTTSSTLPMPAARTDDAGRWLFLSSCSAGSRRRPEHQLAMLRFGGIASSRRGRSPRTTPANGPGRSQGHNASWATISMRKVVVRRRDLRPGPRAGDAGSRRWWNNRYTFSLYGVSSCPANVVARTSTPRLPDLRKASTGLTVGAATAAGIPTAMLRQRAEYRADSIAEPGESHLVYSRSPSRHSTAESRRRISGTRGSIPGSASSSLTMPSAPVKFAADGGGTETGATTIRWPPNADMAGVRGVGRQIQVRAADGSRALHLQRSGQRLPHRTRSRARPRGDACRSTGKLSRLGSRHRRRRRQSRHDV